MVSHDAALLELMDDTDMLYQGRLTVFGGSYSAWREHLRREQDAALRAERAAEQALAVEQRQRVGDPARVA